MKTTIENAITNIDDKFVDETIQYIKINGTNRKKNLRVIQRLVACVAAVMLLFCSGVTVAVAAGSIQAYEMLYIIFPNIAIKMVPINKSCVDKGIKMSVEAVNIEGNTADIYISLQDIEGNRLDETVDLFDSYDIHTNVDQIAGCEMVSYDKVNKIATFLISIQQNKKIQGKYMRFSVAQMLTGKKELITELPQVLQAKETENIKNLSEVNLRGYEFGEVGESLRYKSILVPNESQSYSPVAGVTLTAYGFIDGKLHVQVLYDDILKYDNHGYVHLEKEGEVVYPECKNSFWDEEQKGSYDEYIFDISLDEIQQYKIIGDFTTSQTLIEGDWHVAFPIESR